MEEIIVDTPEYNSIIIEVGKKQVPISCSISIGDIELIFDSKKEEVSSRDIVQLVVIRKIENYLEEPLENKATVADGILLSFIDGCLNNSISLKEIFDECLQADNHYDRFIKSIIIEFEKASESFRSTVNTFAVMLQNNIRPLQELITNNIATVLQPVIETLEQMKSAFSSQLQNCFVPGISDEEKAQYIKQYELWGTYGWAELPSLDNRFFLNTIPKDIKEANMIMKPFTTNRCVDELFLLLESFSTLKKTDLREAKFGFENKKWKSCAMVLFSMIDSVLIRSMKDEDRTGKNGYRPSGAYASKKLKRRFAEYSSADGLSKVIFMQLLKYYGLFSAIQAYFETSNDFKKQPVLASRNFVDHGMLYGPVRRQDCVKLLSILFNLHSLKMEGLI